MRRPPETTQAAAVAAALSNDGDQPLTETQPDAPEPANADTRILRRAVVAGAVVSGVLAIVLLAANAIFGGGGASALVWICAAVVIGTLVTAGWLVLGLLLDMVAGQTPSPRRALWTAAAFVLAFVSPVLPAAALRAASGA